MSSNLANTNMKQLLTFFLANLLFLSSIYAQQTKNKMNYKNIEIEIKFPGSFEEKENGSFNATIDENYVKGYFLNFEKIILFHEDDQQKYYTTENGEMIPTQHVITSTGYLSSLYVYPVLGKTALLKEVKKAFETKNAKFTYREIKEISVGKHKVFNWRTQHYKNRFEYYLLMGKTYNYLFISTPYGEKDYIEKLLLDVKFINEEK